MNAHLQSYTSPATNDYPTGRTWQFQFSSGNPNAALNGNLLSITDPDGAAVVQLSYDGQDRVISETRGGGTWMYSYALSGSTRTTTVTDPRGAMSTLTWEGGNKYPTKIEQFTNLNIRPGEPDSYVWKNEYDANHNLTARVTPEGRRVDFTYDGAGNVVEVRHKQTDTPNNGPSDKVWTYAYGAKRQMTQATDASGQVILYTWDPGGRLVRIDYPQNTGETVQTPYETFDHNAFGQKIAWTDRDGIETRWTYFNSGPAKGRVQTMERGPLADPETTSWVYDTYGNVTSMTNPAGNQVFATYDASHQLVEFTRAAAGSPRTRFQYNGRGRVVQMEREYLDDLGSPQPNPWITRTFKYNAQNRMTQVKDEVSLGADIAWDWQYDAVGNVIRRTGPSGRQETYVYDERNFLYKTIQAEGTPDQGTESFDYTGNGRLARHVRENGSAVNYVYDAFGRLVVQRNAINTEVRYEYGPLDQVTRRSTWDSNNLQLTETLYTHDESGRLVQERRVLLGATPQQFTTNFYWTPGSRISKVVNHLGVAAELTYNVFGRLVTYSRANGKERLDYTYDSLGRRTAVEETLFNSVTQLSETYRFTYTYDAAGNVLEARVWDRLNPTQYKSVSGTYDSFDRRVSYIDENGDSARFVYEDGGPLTEVVREVRNGQGQVTGTRRVTFSYVSCAVFNKATDDNGKGTEYEHDARGRVVMITYPDQSTHTFDYAYGHKLASETYPNGTVVAYTHDALGRLTQVNVTRAAGVGGTTFENYAYDALGRMILAVNDTTTTMLQWDPLHRVTSETTGPNPLGSNGKTVTATYDGADNLLGLTYAGGAVVSHVYGPDGDVQSTTRNASSLADYQHLGTSLLLARDYVNSTSLSFSYDGYLRPVNIDHKVASVTFSSFNYAYRPNGTLLFEQRNHLGGSGDTYGYDRDSGITTVLRGVANPPAEIASPGSQPYVTRYDYALDGVVNRASVTTTPFGGIPTATLYNNDSRNLYTSVGGMTRTHDMNGNLKDDGTHTYTYDYRDRLVEVVNKTTQATVLSFDYDTGGRPYQVTTAAGAVRQVHWDRDVTEEYSPTSLLREYAHSPHGVTKPISMHAGGTQYMFHENLQGSVTHVTGTGGTLVEQYRYDEFGGHTVHNGGGTPITTSAIGNPYRFAAQRYHAQPSMYAYGVRVYDPGTGRFLQQDPLGAADNVNLTSAMNHNPLLFADIDGFEIRIRGTATFQARAQRAIERLRNSGPTGRRLVERLEGDGHTTDIRSGRNVHQRTGEDSSTIYYDWDDCWGDRNENGNSERPPWVALGHEMQHAVDHADGIAHDPPRGRRLGRTETSAVRTENAIRHEAGLPQRVRYGSHDTTHLRDPRAPRRPERR